MSTPPHHTAVAIAWRRVEIPGAGMTIELHPTWETIDGDHIVWQRFALDAGEGTVALRWGADATIEDVLAHVGLGTGGTRTIEADEEVEIDGVRARRIALRIVAPEAYSHEPGQVHPAERERIYVAVGFNLAEMPVLSSYAIPASTFAAMAPLLEYVIQSARRTGATKLP